MVERGLRTPRNVVPTGPNDNKLFKWEKKMGEAGETFQSCDERSGSERSFNWNIYVFLRFLFMRKSTPMIPLTVHSALSFPFTEAIPLLGGPGRD